MTTCSNCKAPTEHTKLNGYIDTYCRSCRKADLQCMLSGVEKVGGRGKTQSNRDDQKDREDVVKGIQWVIGCATRLPESHPTQRKCAKAIRVIVDTLIPSAHQAYKQASRHWANEERAKVGLPADDSWEFV